MSKIKQLTQVIRNYAECELDYGTIKTLKMIDDEADRLEQQLQNTPPNSDYVKCPNCGSSDGTYSMGERCISCHEEI